MAEFSGRVLVVVGAALSIVFMIGGFTLGYLYTRPEVNYLRSQIEELNTQLDEARSRALDAENERSRLERLLEEVRGLLGEAQRELADKQREIDELTDKLEKVASEAEERIKELESKTESLKRVSETLGKAVPLLTQLRERFDISPEREDALNYWMDIKALAAEFEPELTPSIDRIISNIDGWVQYNEWLKRAPGIDSPPEEVVEWLFEQPESADAYFDAIDQFMDEVQNAVASKILALREIL